MKKPMLNSQISDNDVRKDLSNEFVFGNLSSEETFKILLEKQNETINLYEKMLKFQEKINHRKRLNRFIIIVPVFIGLIIVFIFSNNWKIQEKNNLNQIQTFLNDHHN